MYMPFLAGGKQKTKNAFLCCVTVRACNVTVVQQLTKYKNNVFLRYILIYHLFGLLTTTYLDYLQHNIIFSETEGELEDDSDVSINLALYSSRLCII